MFFSLSNSTCLDILAGEQFHRHSVVVELVGTQEAWLVAEDPNLTFQTIDAIVETSDLLSFMLPLPGEGLCGS